jgi:hypothetical protein
METSSACSKPTLISNLLTPPRAAAKYQDNTVVVYKAATYHTIYRDNSYCYPFEDIPRLLITCRYSGATLPRNEIVFRHIFERRQAATRETLQARRSYATQTIRKRLGIAMQLEHLGDPIIRVTKKDNTSNE